MQEYTSDSAEQLKDRSVEEASEDEDNTEAYSRNVGVMLVGVFVFFLMFLLLSLCCMLALCSFL
jgi:hypothetical protein